MVGSINYRVAPTARFPEPLEDVKAAIRYLKANAAKWGIDSEHVGIVGGSAGGYLTAMAATTSGTKRFDKGENLQVTSDVQAAVDLYGLSDLTQVGSDFSEDAQHGGIYWTQKPVLDLITRFFDQYLKKSRVK